MAFLMPLSLAIILFFFVNTFLNWFLFQMDMSLTNLSIASPKWVEWFQAWNTIVGKEKSASQQIWNFKGQGRWSWFIGFDSSRTRQWSEWQQVRLDILASRYIMHQSKFTKNLSILSWIKAPTSLLFVQVNLGPEKPKSIMLQLSRHSLNSNDLEMLTTPPPYLSSSKRASLKSPAITQGILWSSANIHRLFHNIRFLANRGLA